jgi:hypothetical protein
MAELHATHKPRPIVADGAGPVGSLLADLDAAGMSVKVTSVRDYQQACGAFYDAVVGGEVLHPDQEDLQRAVDAADKRTEADAWMWSRRNTTADISPLVSVTLAHWAHRLGGGSGLVFAY